MDKPLSNNIEDLVQTLPPAGDASFEKHKKALYDSVAYLIHHDFEKLLRLLYTVDVDERVLKLFLQQQPQPDAAIVITELLVQRQWQKWETRRQMQQEAPPSDEERW